ncbi:GntR family transcriptional regulator [Sinomonas mesophila]|uniref:GntR family transcriptional regulator n=1 Tax=Sinomonas mesophila TaxID=1531955 RepID=UPI00158E653F|nr:GntR family transcriptional regulator [Sinomonas mesophila]
MTKAAGLSAITPKPIAVRIADLLRERIVHGLFAPGEQINEALVARQLGVSRPSVREALQRLCQEGLLVNRPNRGVFVIELTNQDVEEIYGVREILEIGAAEIITARSAQRRREVSDELVGIASQLPAALAASDWALVSRLDLDFHTALIVHAGNSRLLRAYSTLAAESLICMFNLEQAYPTPNTLSHDHMAMAKLIADGTMTQIHSAFHRHLSGAEGHATATLEARSLDHHGPAATNGL